MGEIAVSCAEFFMARIVPKTPPPRHTNFSRAINATVYVDVALLRIHETSLTGAFLCASKSYARTDVFCWHLLRLRTSTAQPTSSNTTLDGSGIAPTVMD